MTGGKIALLITGIVLAMLGLGTALAGGGLLWADTTQRGDDGYLTSPTYTLETGGYALATEEIVLGGPSPEDFFPALAVRLDVEASEGGEVFVGVGPREAVEAYLAGVAHATVSRLGVVDRDGVAYRTVTGSEVPARPAAQDFWQASAAGPGSQRLAWEAERGTWAVVVMNADASPGVRVEMSASAEAGFLGPLAIVLLVVGLVLLAVGAGLVVAATARAVTATPAAPRSQGDAVPVGASRHPLVIEGRLDEPLSRWLWLVKWLLLVPHLVVLVFLWFVFVALTIVAGIAILFTGRYPRSIFAFNVGVLRWTWRVVYYGYSALGTDRYPPFTLESVAYPATLEIAYPEQLSRGLVLVKWWLLALPHYLIIGLFAGGGLAWTSESERWGSWAIGAGGGLIGLLVLIAGLMLLVRAHYPRGLFDLVLGLNRWVYRVITYAALMTDVYPPFRLDPGGADRPLPAAPEPTGNGPSSAAPPELAHH